jgi:hypothetical protein
LLTTGTTIGGLLPLYFGGGPMWESMAITIIFGLAFATLLTLGVVPILYSFFYRVSFKDFVYESPAAQGVPAVDATANPAANQETDS